MALLLMEGFDSYGSYTDFGESQGRVNDAGSGLTFPAGRIDGQCANIDTYGQSYIQLSFDETTATQWLGFAFYPESLTQWPSTEFVEVRDSTGTVIWLLYGTSGGEFVFRRGPVSGGTDLGTTSSGGIPAQEWTYVSVEVYVHDTTGTVTIKFNGITVLSLTSQDTKHNNDGATNVRLSCTLNTAEYVRYDDVIFGDNSGTDLTAHPGNCHIERLLPDGDGTTNNFTAVGAGTTNADRVDETATDDDTTYVHSSTAADKELYNFGSCTSTSTYLAVQPMYRMKQTVAGTRTVNGIVRSNTSEADSAAHGLGTDYGWYHYIEENDPNGGGAWTESAINAAQAGVEIAS